MCLAQGHNAVLPVRLEYATVNLESSTLTLIPHIKVQLNQTYGLGDDKKLTIDRLMDDRNRQQVIL